MNKIVIGNKEVIPVEQTNVKIKVCLMRGTIYFIEIPYQIYKEDRVESWIAQNLKNVDYWEYWR